MSNDLIVALGGIAMFMVGIWLQVWLHLRMRAIDQRIKGQKLSIIKSLQALVLLDAALASKKSQNCPFIYKFSEN
jgi:hypothetical protein